MPSLKIYIALSFLFVVLSFTEAGIIKNTFTGLFGGKKEQTERPAVEEDNYRSPGSVGQNKPSGEYGAGGTYTKKPIVVDGTTEKYKNTSWYIENEDYLSPNRNETKQQRPGGQYGAAGTYTVRPMGGTTERYTGNGGYGNFGDNTQQRPSDNYNSNNFNNRENPNSNNFNNRENSNSNNFNNRENNNSNNFNNRENPNSNNFNNRENYNSNNFNNRENNNSNNFNNRETSNSNNFNNQQNHNSNNYNQRQSDGPVRGQETTRSSINNSKGSVVLRADDITCQYSNLKEEVGKRKLTCNEKSCVVDQVYEKSSLWVCGGIKCTIANVDFSKDHGSKSLMECSVGRHIIDVPVRCGPDEKEVRGVCRKVF